MVWATADQSQTNSPPAQTRSANVTGFSLSVGGSFFTNQTSSKVSYDYQNLFGGSLGAPGFEVYDSYDTQSIAGLQNGVKIKLSHVGRFFGRVMLGLSLNALYGPDLKTSIQSYTFTDSTGAPDNPATYELDSSFQPKPDLSVGFEPGFLIGDSLLVLFKISAHNMNATVNSSIPATVTGTTGAPVTTQTSISKNFLGYGAGVSLRFSLNEHLYYDLSGEAVEFLGQKIDAPSLSNANDEITITQTQYITPKWTEVTVAFGYFF